MIKIMYICIAIAIIAGVLSAFLLKQQPTESGDTPVPEGVMCTMDARQCPDGSFVGRTGPKCEFVCPESATDTVPADYRNEVTITKPIANSVLGTSTIVTGTALGSWYFEGSFGVELLDANGSQIAVSPAVAEGDWMTASAVPFSAKLAFSNPYKSGVPDKMKGGTLVLRNDNPSGLPENDKFISIPRSWRYIVMNLLERTLSSGVEYVEARYTATASPLG